MSKQNDYLDKRKIAGIERRAAGTVKSENYTGLFVTLAIVAAFAISTTHLFWALRGGGWLGFALGILTSLATEGIFLHHRYRTFPHYENKTQMSASLLGMVVAILGSLVFIGADLLLLLGLLDVAAFAPVAIGGMVAVMLSAVLSESVYELSSRVAQFERERRADALEVLRVSDATRLELDKGDLEIMRAYSDLALAATFQKAANIRAAIPDHVARESGQVEMLTADDIRSSMGTQGTQPVNLRKMAQDLAGSLSGNHKAPKGRGGGQ